MSGVFRSALVGAAVISALAVSSCGDETRSEPAADTTVETSDPAAVTTIAPNGEEVAVLALDNNFRDEEIEIVAGTTVVWENGGRNDHNIVPVDDTGDWGVDIEKFQPGDVYSYAFTTPGEYPYYCTLHGTADFGMIGTIVVTG